MGYWDQVVPLIRAGGAILVDNTLSNGRVIDPVSADPNVRSIRDFNDSAAVLFRSDVLADAFGVPADGARPLLRAVAHVRTATCCWIAAAAGGYHDGENTLAGWGS